MAGWYGRDGASILAKFTTERPSPGAGRGASELFCRHHSNSEDASSFASQSVPQLEEGTVPFHRGDGIICMICSSGDLKLPSSLASPPTPFLPPGMRGDSHRLLLYSSNPPVLMSSYRTCATIPVAINHFLKLFPGASKGAILEQGEVEGWVLRTSTNVSW